MKTYSIKDGGEEWRIEANDYVAALIKWQVNVAHDTDREPESISIVNG